MDFLGGDFLDFLMGEIAGPVLPLLLGFVVAALADAAGVGLAAMMDV